MIKIKADDITINILPSTSKNTEERNFELLVNYVSVLQEIYNDTNCHADMVS